MNRGFTIFFAMLVASLSLAVGLAIYDLTIRELDLSATVTQSEYAIYAADTGAECALYWDSKCPESNTTACVQDGASFSSAFATSSNSTFAGAPNNSHLYCVGNDITNTADPSDYNTSQKSSSAATTTFVVTLGSGTSQYCATVTVAKYGSPSNTTITSAGHNTCAGSGNTLQLERSLQVTY